MVLLTLLTLSLATHAFAQIVYDSAHNVTSIVGTWSSGSQNVVTGAGFAQPANESFIYPPTTGISYSFSSDGYYEIARYRMAGNGTQPSCITGVMNWCHGTYDLVSNGSIILTPLGDGYQQIQDPCAPVSNFIENYNDTELYMLWSIYQDAVRGYALLLYDAGGAPLAPQWQLSSTPNMLPTQQLRNVTAPTTTTTKTTKSAVVLLANAGERSWSVSGLSSVFALIAGLGIASVLL